MNPAIFFEPDGYLLTGPRLMGRQAAGHGFLRAAVQDRGNGPVVAYTPFRRSAAIFERAVADIDPTARSEWIPGQRLDRLAQNGLLYRPDHELGPMARQRLRVGPAAYSLCGVTHTLATHGSLDAIAKILLEPVMPWDAVICTSKAARSVVEAVLQHQADMERWRLGAVVETRPLLPVIPLGVHTSDFAFDGAEREASRREFGIGAGQVAVLFAGRLSLNGKAHPYPMLRAVQRAAEDTGKEIVLLLSGQAFNEAIDKVFRDAVATHCPSVRSLFVDGRDANAYRRAWAGADLFISLSDSLQETFGITPVEAMAAGLPSVVSDWNGYKDTVRDGVDGFRIRTWAPPPGVGAVIAHDYEIGLDRYEEYLGRSTMAVAVDMDQLCARVRDLVADGDLRRRMGAAAQARARSDFDWSVVYRSYRAMWAEQAAIRAKAAADAATSAWLARAPRTGADHMGPFDTFASYPTGPVSPQTQVIGSARITPDTYRRLIDDPLLAFMAVAPALVDLILAGLDKEPASVEVLARTAGVPLPSMMETVARLAKIGVVALAPP